MRLVPGASGETDQVMRGAQLIPSCKGENQQDQRNIPCLYKQRM